VTAFSEPLAGVPDAAALKAIAGAMRNELHQALDFHRQLAFLAERLTRAVVHTGPDGRSYEMRVPGECEARLRAIAARFYAAEIAPMLETAKELEDLAADARPVKV
jgi:hypothetical protein